MKRFIIGMCVALAVMFAAPANAATGTMSHYEWDSINYNAINFTGTGQQQVNAICQCTGDVGYTGTVDGHPYKEVHYDAVSNDVYVDEVDYWMSNAGNWHAFGGAWCTHASGCEEH